ncbi:MAG TPA: aminodeoxychorismate synthase, component I, partial [Verrucomicrobiae bacterium]|nr:aminodeoxychorismate synthase, component I [Verrucomicrobiae bacterium]
MRTLIQEIQSAHTPESLVERLTGATGIVLLRSASFDAASARYSFVAANPFVNFKSSGSRCELTQHATHNTQIQFGNPWHLLDGLMSRYEVLDEVDLPF